MSRLVAIFALAFATALPALAHAGTPLWGYLVHDQEGTFVAGHWPSEDKRTFGGDDDDDVHLDGLEDGHFDVLVRGTTFTIRPDEEVVFEGQTTKETLELSDGQSIRAGDYTITFLLAAEEHVDYQLAHSSEEPTGPAPAPSIAEAAARAAIARKKEFDRPAYEFCHDPDYAKGGVIGHEFCTIFDESTHEVCPEVANTCPWEELDAKLVFGRFQDDAGKGPGTGKRKPRRKRKKPTVVRLPAIPPFIAYGVLAVIIAAILFMFFRQLKDAGWEKSELELAEEEIDEAALDLQSLPEARSHVLLKLAERALNRGEAQEAAVLLHLAVLRHIDDEGLARYHPSKTNGDYLRSIRRHKPIAKLFRGVANQTERVRFGDGRVDQQRIRELLAEGRQLLVPGSEIPAPFAPGAASILVLAFLGSAMQGCPGGGDDNRAYYSHGPAGMAAFTDVLREAGMTPVVKLGRVSDIPYDVRTFVFRTSSSRDGKMPKGMKFDELLERGASIVVIDDLGKAPFFLPNTSTTGPSRDAKPEAVELEMPLLPKHGECSMRFTAAAAYMDRDRVKLPRGFLINWSGEHGTAPVSDEPLRVEPLLYYRGEAGPDDGAVALAAQRQTSSGPLPGCVYVFSDRDLFTNASLTRRSNARFVAAFFATLTQNDPRIWFIDSIDRWTTSTTDTGSGGPDKPDDPTKPLRASNMLPLLLQGLVTLALLYVLLGAAFGPLRDPAHREHKAFVEHVEAIGRQYARCGRPGVTHAAAALARLVVMRNRERIRGAGAGWAQVARELAQKHDLPEEDVRAALRLGIEGKSELGAPRVEDPAPASETMLKTLSRLLGGRRAELRPTVTRKKRDWGTKKK